MVARSTAPAQPELHRQNNGLRVIRYPYQTQKGTTVARNFKLGWCKEDEALRQFQVFQHHWKQMNGKGPAGVIAKMTKKPPRPKIAPTDNTRALVPKSYKGKTPDQIEAQRKYSRDYQQRKKNGGGDIDADLARVQDHIGVIASSLSAVGTSVRMLQDMVTGLQRKRGA